jgi:hypothetical protein
MIRATDLEKFHHDIAEDCPSVVLRRTAREVDVSFFAERH